MHIGGKIEDSDDGPELCIMEISVVDEREKGLFVGGFD